MTTEHPTSNDPSAAVLSFLRALNDEDFTSARKYLSDDMKFEGVMGSRDGAESYIEDMKKMKLKYDIKKVFAEGDDLGIFYNIAMSGKDIFCAGWYTTKDGRITLIKVIFDPRPLL